MAHAAAIILIHQILQLRAAHGVHMQSTNLTFIQAHPFPTCVIIEQILRKSYHWLSGCVCLFVAFLCPVSLYNHCYPNMPH
uniref:Secreted protein n=1 Tax=Rhipicephalus appendiculatus TaxID=34631 RepID=A0A131YDD9_RHIAP